MVQRKCHEIDIGHARLSWFWENANELILGIQSSYGSVKMPKN
jgi:hypothetical protein